MLLLSLYLSVGRSVVFNLLKVTKGNQTKFIWLRAARIKINCLQPFYYKSSCCCVAFFSRIFSPLLGFIFCKVRVELYRRGINFFVINLFLFLVSYWRLLILFTFFLMGFCSFLYSSLLWKKLRMKIILWVNNIYKYIHK